MILFITTLFFIFTLICAKNVRYGIYAIIFLMPLYLIRFSIFGIPSTVLEIMIYILFLVWVLNKMKGNLLYKNFRPVLVEGFSGFNHLCKNNYILSIGIILLFLGLTISTFGSADLRISLGIFKGWFFDPFLFFIVFVSVIKKDKQVILSLKSWIFSGVAVSLISIFYLLNNEFTFDGRLKAFFLSPNHLAMYISPAFLITVWFLLKEAKLPIGSLASNWKTDFSSKKMKVIILIIISIPLFFTYSCGAFLGIFMGILYLFIKNRKLKIKNIYLLGFALFLLVGFIFISSNKFDQIINSDNRSSFHSRLMIWNTATEIIKDNPIFGIGPGTFQKTYLSYAERFDEPYLEWAVPQPHNIFLAFYIQTGLIGFVGFILILSWFFRNGLKNNVSACGMNIPVCRMGRQHPCSPSRRAVFNILVSLMIYTIIHGLVDTTYWKNDLSLMFWLNTALLLTSFKIYTTMASQDEKEKGTLKIE